MKNILFTKLSLVALFTFASTTFAAPALKSEGKVQAKVVKNEIHVTTEPGFHLNKDAPADLTMSGSKSKISPKPKTEKLFVFKTPAPTGEGTANVYVCDDANTVCEPHQLKVSWSKPVAALDTKPDQAAQVSDTNSNSETTPAQKDLEKVLAQAKKSNKLVMIDFTAKWCPPCIRMEHEVFNTKEFKNLKSKYIVHIIDVDKESNYDILKTYSIKAFPTIVVVNSSGEELVRYLDYQEKTPFIADLKRVSQKRPLAIPQATLKAEAGDKSAALQLADHYYKSLQYTEAMKWYGKSLGLPYYESKVGAAEELGANREPGTKIYYQQTLKDAIAAEPESFPALSWRYSLAESLDAKAPEREMVLRELIQQAQLWIDHPERIKAANAKGYLTELRNLEIPEAFAKMGDAYELLGDKQKHAQSYENAVAAVLKLNPTEKQPMELIYLIAYMTEVKPLAEIEPWILKLRTAYPGEFTYVQRHARVLMKKNEFERALPIAQQAYDMSYGNNKFTSGLLLAQIKKDLKQKKEAKDLVTGLLQSEEAKSPRNKRIVHSLEDFVKNI